MNLTRYLPTPIILASFLVVFLFSYVAGFPVLQDLDIGWHIVAGDLIRANNSLPVHDTLSFSGSDQIWYNISWLWDILLSFVHEQAGIEGLFILSALLTAIVTAYLVSCLWKRGDIGVNAIIFIAMITCYNLLEFASARPQIIGVFLAIIFHHILHISRSQVGNWKLFLLPFIMVLWVNTHGSFFMGFIVLGAYGLEALYHKNMLWFKRLFIVGFLCLITTIINPYGIHITTAAMRSMSSVITAYVSEWRPFIFGVYSGPTMLFLAFLMFGNLRNGNVLLADKILAVFFILTMLVSIRNSAFLAVLGAPYLAANLPEDNEKDSHTRKLKAWVGNRAYSPALMASIPVVVIGSYFLLPLLDKEHYLEKSETSPMPAINYVLGNYPDKRVLNDYDIGGRIIYETKGKLPVFMDGRAPTVYNEKILSDFIAFNSLEKGWEERIAPYNIDVILVQNSRSFAKDYEKGLYNDKWKQVYRDEVASVYVKK